MRSRPSSGSLASRGCRAASMSQVTAPRAYDRLPVASSGVLFRLLTWLVILTPRGGYLG
jgi:hypothetical protein